MKKGKATQGNGSWTVIAIWFMLAYFGYYRMHLLPDPVQKTNELIFSEGNALETITVLSKDIGMRVVGTRQETEAFEYLWTNLLDLKRSKHPLVNFADGSHLFEIMGEKVVKAYQNISNIVVKLSCDNCSSDAILLNAHFDSTLVTPGAADDAVGCAILLELVRLFSQQENLLNSIIFLFNGAEETLQDASHAFITMHPLAPTVKAVINLEAMGSYGREILFQANSRELVEAYANVPRPHATSASNDVFSTGLLLSDTDFRQFVQYGNLVGLDFAFYQNSYHYHTMLDTVENIQVGSVQHFGDNIFALLKDLATKKKGLDLNHENNLLYFDFLGFYLFRYSQTTAFVINMLAVVFGIYVYSLQAKAMNLTAFAMLGCLKTVFSDILLGIIVTLVASSILAIKNPMSWFSNEFYPIVLFSQTFFIGAFYRSLHTEVNPVEYYRWERIYLLGLGQFWTILLVLATLGGLGSSFLLLFHSISISFGLFLDLVISQWIIRNHVSIWAYLAILIPVTSLGTLMALSINYVFVPVAGRIGPDAPVDVIVPIVIVLVILMSQSIIAIVLIWRIPKNYRKSVFQLLALFMIVTLLAFSTISPYNSNSPKRVFCSYMENTTSQERGVHISYSDFGKIPEINEILKQELGVEPLKRTVEETDRDWAILFPFSHFLDSYYFNLSDSNLEPSKEFAPHLKSHSTFHENGTRTIFLECHHPHFIWTVLKFRANISSWSLSADPLDQIEHTIRHVSGDFGSKWNFSMNVIGSDPIPLEISGIERDGFNHMIPNSSPDGMNWIWTDRWQSASILGKVERIMPKWTVGMFVGVAVSNHIVI